ncbi:MAG: flagellar hook-basal body complex protein FliE [Deltaproteobacteria bacterium]|nr:flagellar hook-basal body complex protein FliE [Deltaproteobacteria bacterium]
MRTLSVENGLTYGIADIQKKDGAVANGTESFGKMLQESVQEINKLQTDADVAIKKVELEGSGSIHEAIIALEKADISFRAVMQVRNKILEAYQEVMRMQV